MLTPVTGQAKKRHFITYDFEWIPGKLEIRLAGVYDGKEYRCYRTIADFLNGEIHKGTRHAWFYAHSGGRADLLFILEEVSKNPAYEVEARMSGSSAVIATITRHTHSDLCKYGGTHGQGDHSNCWQWTFVDSFWLFRTSLAQIGEKLGQGFNKSGPDVDEPCDKDPGCGGYQGHLGACDPGHDIDQLVRDWYANVPFMELRDYNEQDNRILWHGIAQFEETLLSIGGELQKTIAACGMRLFRRKYLTKPIDVIHNHNEAAKEAYHASRVEVIQYRATRGYSYDVNSSFPYAMTFSAPGNAIRRRMKRLPDDRTDLYVARAEIIVPDTFDPSNGRVCGYLPPMPYRRKHRVFFPTGRWTSWFSGVDLQLLENEGGKIVRVFESIEFEPCDDLRQYAEDLYARRDRATSDFEKIVYKYLLNALYGKFNESEEKCTLLMNPSAEKLDALYADECKTEDELGYPPPQRFQVGAWVQYHLADVQHNHTPMAMHITAIARRTLFQFDKQVITTRHADGGYCELHYNDTDSLSTNALLFQDSKKLGGLKLEEAFTEAEYVAPKVYKRRVLKKVDGKWPVPLDSDPSQWPEENLSIKVKAKGFSLGKAPTTQLRRFNELVENKEIEIERMARLKEMLDARTWQPFEKTVVKRLTGAALTKRKRLADGKTRPWTVEELDANRKLI